eukprot:m.611971 g.611971  ORF g.611971 m.611971 type:complete len:79 (+) comp22500_c0_seq56:3266-3502(+)
MPAEQDPCAAVVHVANSLDVWLALVRDVFCMHLRVTEAPAADATDLVVDGTHVIHRFHDPAVPNGGERVVEQTQNACT